MTRRVILGKSGHRIGVCSTPGTRLIRRDSWLNSSQFVQRRHPSSGTEQAIDESLAGDAGGEKEVRHQNICREPRFPLRFPADFDCEQE
jgi:hypothetical protein